MAILPKWTKKSTRNSVVQSGPTPKSSQDQLPSISPRSHRTVSASSTGTEEPASASQQPSQQPQQQPQQSQQPQSQQQPQQQQPLSPGALRQSQSYIPSPQLPGKPGQKPPTQGNMQRKISNGGAFNSRIPVLQQQPQASPNQAVVNMRSPSGGSTSSSVYTNGISSPPASSNSNMSANMPPPPQQQQLQQLRYNGSQNGGPMSPMSPMSPNGPGPQQQGGAQLQQRRGAPPPSGNNPNIPQYPWSQRSVSNASPFPRYGHAANYIAARDGEVFVMGGLKGANVFGDLWVIETGRFQLPSLRLHNFFFY